MKFPIYALISAYALTPLALAFPHSAGPVVACLMAVALGGVFAAARRRA